MGRYSYNRILVAVDDNGKIAETCEIGPLILETKRIGDQPKCTYPEGYDKQYDDFHARNKARHLHVNEGLADSIASFLRSFPEVTRPYRKV